MSMVFFRASKDALDRITAAFDFIHPLTASMRYARKKITELGTACESLSEEEMQQEIDPEHKVHGVNYKRAFIDASWEVQEELLAWFLLNNLFAIHEGWIERIYDDVFQHYRTAAFSYNESTFSKNLEHTGLKMKLRTYYCEPSRKSIALESAFFDKYKDASGLDFGKLDNYMLCYRFFKEMRNCYMHRNFTASQQLVEAYTAYLPVAVTTALDVSEVPVAYPPVLGQSVRISLRGVIGFSQIVQRIIVITDIHLLCAAAAEKELIERKPTNWICRNLSARQNRKEEQIISYSRAAGFLKNNWSEEYKELLVRNQIFTH